ncbi:hypothetical protein Zmor_011497 [Zophobas morio]|uniref:Uncharacterized protein n=1 Tax=Zophobas morio TaxID=2755281 RepID=A0AA38IQ85_9CUCU|nr:hypothetical protein Zmor_011497 [Zophobas morio]
MSPKIKEKLRQDLRHGFISMIVGLILGLLTGILIGVPGDEDKDFMFVIQLIKYLPKCKITVLMIHLTRFFTCLVTYLSALLPAHHMVYGFIKQRTVAYIKGISIGWDILRLISLISILIFNLHTFTVCGQSVEDLSYEIFDTSVLVKWYHWSQVNKKMFLMYLINAQKPFKISYSDKISVNYQLAVDILRTFVSALTFVVQLQNARMPHGERTPYSEMGQKKYMDLFVGIFWEGPEEVIFKESLTRIRPMMDSRDKSARDKE